MWVDSHLHIWDTGKISYPWLEETLELPRVISLVATPVPPEVDQVVVVQADAAPEQSLAEVDWIVEQGRATSGPRLGGIVAWAPLDDASAIGDYLESLQERPAVVGIRQLFQNWDQGYIGTGAVDHGVAAVGRAGLPLDICVRWWQLPEVVDLLNRSPAFPMVLDHCGKPPLGDTAGMARWRDELTRLAKLEHLHVKLSGLYPELDPEQEASGQLSDALEFVLATFGPGRAMFGSDWPVSDVLERTSQRPTAPAYQRWLDRIRTLTDESSDVMGGTARRFYQLPTLTR